MRWSFSFGAFEQQVSAPRDLVLGMYKHPPFYFSLVALPRDPKRKPRIRNGGAVRGNHFLSVSSLLQGAKDIFKIARDFPLSLGAEVTRRNLNVQPTIKIRAGYRFNVRVNRDVLFDAPYHLLEM